MLYRRISIESIDMVVGTAFKDVKGKLYPIVGMKRNGEHILANFGQTPFVFDIDGTMKEEQARVRKAISETSTSKLAGPSMSETALIQQLVRPLASVTEGGV